MPRKSLIFAAIATAVFLLTAGTGSARPAVGSPKLPGIVVSSPLDFGAVFHLGTKLGVQVTISTLSSHSGLPGLRARLFLPGLQIVKLYPVSAVPGVKPATIQRAGGGAIWTFHAVPSGFADGFQFLAKAKGPVGRQLADKLVLTLANGKTATYVVDSYKLVH